MEDVPEEDYWENIKWLYEVETGSTAYATEGETMGWRGVMYVLEYFHFNREQL
jgi:hypothetical protein